MAYIYSNPDREDEQNALPDVEIFYASQFDCDEWNENGTNEEPEEYQYTPGWYYAYGLIGCLWDSEPIGPHETEAEAIAAVHEENEL